MAYQYHVDSLNRSSATGWIFLSEEPGKPVPLELELDGKVIARFAADQPRADLIEKGIAGHGRCAFHIPLANNTEINSAQSIVLRVQNSNFVLASIRLPPNHKTAQRLEGFWIDRKDFLLEASKRYNQGLLTKDLFNHCMEFAVKGYTVFKNAIPDELIDQINQDVDQLWTENSKAIIETFQIDGQLRYVPASPQFKGGTNKLLDLYVFSEAARQAIFHQTLSQFLRLIFEGPAVAFQSLSFLVGSEQSIHKDTAYVRVTPPLQLVASWMALEDIKSGTGELEYFVGSHLDEHYLFGGDSKWSYLYPNELETYLRSLHEDAKRHGHRKEVFQARKGDVLFWHADLAHGGSKILDKAATRKSLVTHYCPQSAKVFYTENPHYKLSWGEQLFTSAFYSHLSP